MRRLRSLNRGLQRWKYKFGKLHVKCVEKKWGLRCMLLLFRRHHISLVNLAFVQWKFEVHESKLHTALLQRIICRWQLLRVGACLSKWKHFKAQRQRTRELARRLLQRLLHIKVLHAWSKWLHIFTYQSICETSARRLRQQKIFKTFSRWMEYTSERLNLRHMVYEIKNTIQYV
jgi:hypothetical protein